MADKPKFTRSAYVIHDPLLAGRQMEEEARKRRLDELVRRQLYQDQFASTPPQSLPVSPLVAPTTPAQTTTENDEEAGRLVGMVLVACLYVALFAVRVFLENVAQFLYVIGGMRNPRSIELRRYLKSKLFLETIGLASGTLLILHLYHVV